MLYTIRERKDRGDAGRVPIPAAPVPWTQRKAD